MLAAYVTGHGFGHAVRLCEVLRAVRARAPGLPIAVTGGAPEWLVRRDVPAPVEVRPVACDVGLVQRDALRIDLAESAARCAAFDAGWEEAVERESAFLRASGARAVLADVPALAFAAAARAGIPALALANFSWAGIYAHLSARAPSLAASARRAADAYRTAALCLELPFTCDLSVFPRRVPVGLVARRPRLPRAEAKARLGLDGRPAVLVSFGGVGLSGVTPALLRAGTGDRWRFLFPEELGPERLDPLGLEYADAIRAADVVVTKPGYGIVSDAIAAGTRVVYTERGDFPEYDVLVREMPRHLACVHVSNADLAAGRLAEPIARALALPVPPPPDLGGAERAAEHVLAAL
jgi:L-arabinokinase